jgi:hypothetical protein
MQLLLPTSRVTFQIVHLTGLASLLVVYFDQPTGRLLTPKSNLLEQVFFAFSDATKGHGITQSLLNL